MAKLYEFRPEDAIDLTRAIGLETFQRGHELVAKYCPYCHGGRNRDKKTFAINLDTGMFNCRRGSCGAHGNMITFAKDFDLSLGRDADEYFQIRPGRFRRITRQLSEEDVTDPAVEYLRGRGIPEEVTKRYRITTRKDHQEVLVFPFYEPDGMRISFIKYRNPHPAEGQNKEWCEPDCKPILFGMDQCDPEHDTLIMTEGQIDTLSVVTAGYTNCVSVPTGKNGFTWVPHCWDWLQSYKRLIIFGDYEHGGISLLQPMSVRFGGQTLHVRPEDYRDCKDANDILRKYGVEGIRQCIENAVMVEDPTIKPLWEVERKDMSQIPCFPSGLRKLDKVIGGFFMGHLYLITGERGNGKSTFGSQLMARALRNDLSVYMYSGEMPSFMVKSWLDRQLSSGNGLEEYTINELKDYRLTTAQEAVINRFYKDRAYLYSADSLPPGASETQSVMASAEKAITQYGCQVVLIDNLMTAIGDPGPDLNNTQTAFVNQLSELARRCEACIILLVHPRKSSYSTKDGRELGNDDIMGSGNISNAASVVITYNPPAPRFRMPPREICVTKNRIFGITATRPNGIDVWYDPMTKRISETDNDFSWPDDERNTFTPAAGADPDVPF